MLFRSGRAGEKGKVVLQTYAPDNYVLRYATKYDYENFFKHENELRRASKFPPYADILRIMVLSDNDDVALEVLKEVYAKVKEIYNKNKEKFIYFGCMKSPHKKIQNKFRYQILMRVNTNCEELKKEIFSIASDFDIKNVLVYAEENPINLT